jgi:hypothetical protein
MRQMVSRAVCEKTILALAITLGFWAVPSISNGQPRVDIVQIYSNFLASRVAALGCNAVDKTTEPKFLTNFHTVTIRAAQAVKERNPNMSDAELTAKFGASIKFTETAVKNEIANNGCSSERIQRLLKLYKIHSEMNLGG